MAIERITAFDCSAQKVMLFVLVPNRRRTTNNPLGSVSGLSTILSAVQRDPQCAPPILRVFA
jgi:hypothetical protein